MGNQKTHEKRKERRGERERGSMWLRWRARLGHSLHSAQGRAGRSDGVKPFEGTKPYL